MMRHVVPHDEYAILLNCVQSWQHHLQICTKQKKYQGKPCCHGAQAVAIPGTGDSYN